MARKLCTAGVRGPYSYLILDNNDGAVATLHNEIEDVVTTHVDMELAEKWIDNQLQALTGRKYETD